MKISIITAVLNRHETIADAILSTQAQTWSDREHVIQDGGSTDGTLNILRSLADDHTCLRSESDKGIYDAINRGISRSSSDVVGLMHSDDVFAHNRVLEKVADAMSDPEIDGVYGDLEYVSASNPHQVIRYWKSGHYDQARLKYGWMPPHPTVYLRRSVFERWGLYDTRFRISADYDAMLRYLVQGGIKLAYIPEVLVKMRVGGESNRSLGRILLKSREDMIAIQRNSVGGVGTLLSKNFSKVEQLMHRRRTTFPLPHEEICA
ncbi:glycosyltransferase [Pseudovibrio denitrificans]|uniref:Glycosyltransferase n=1 Tax=Pseudovibrio denitrificans TaxID=258256 RepID=A0A1I7CMU7_9HYPH|nr:glycosyltransferase family 2 protein [Pseudovibrio denitrificans]SFU00752.1 glycosyltransferase [Pseudovibrio denitrificans]